MEFFCRADIVLDHRGSRFYRGACDSDVKSETFPFTSVWGVHYAHASVRAALRTHHPLIRATATCQERPLKAGESIADS